MKAKASMTKSKNEDGTIVINLFVKNVEPKSEMESKLIELGYIYMGWNEYRGTANTPAGLDLIRKPIIEMVQAGTIEM